MDPADNSNTLCRRILSIDGGGLLSTYPASFLAAIEDKVGKPLGQYFDLIAGTSGGGIIALGLGLGLSAKDILGLYVEKVPPYSVKGTALPPTSSCIGCEACVALSGQNTAPTACAALWRTCLGIAG